ncbi:MAG: Flp pilus assembly complex ATPase component TadA [Nitrospinae bacterium]|nr:Flp pilus assembly complex ATPase component TadA [Nitrospinota bacterium]
MRVLNNLQKVADILLKRQVVDKEQYDRLIQVLEPPTPRHRRKTARELARKKAHNEETYAPSAVATMKLEGKNGQQLDEDEVMRVVAQEFDLPFLKIDALKLDQAVVTGSIPKPFALRHRILPVKKVGNELTVAVADPDEAVTLAREVEVATGYKVKAVVSSKADIEKILAQFFGFKATISGAEMEFTGKNAIPMGNLEQLSKLKSEDEISASDAHIQNAVNLIFNYALSNRASDIHLEPKREHTLVRMRIDGALVETQKMPRVVHNAIVSRIKVLARMDISEKRRPQDGRIKTEREGKESEMRVSSLPVAFGEKMVIRIFDGGVALQGLENLGFFPDDLEMYKGFLSMQHGIILVTGQTGSGKTSTLYASLKYLYSPEINIVTIEDPIEMVVPELNQVAVQPTIDFTFASALRSILRQDPDIVMVGEIRDKETAQNAVQAALTGHLVISTLHTNDTASSLTRLYDIGVEPYLVKSSLIGIVSQRLVRVICRHCKTDATYLADELKPLGLIGDARLKVGAGCEKCRSTGYFGRTGVHEVLEITDEIREMIDGKTPDVAIMRKAREGGMRTMRENLARKVVEGVTSVEEALSVIGASAW